MPKVTLPAELSCDVVRLLDRATDKQTLFACSLTCKAFLSISRKTIFEKVELFWPPADRSFNARFLSLVRVSPELGSAVRQLHLTFTRLDDDTYILDAAACLALFTNVTDLRIRYVNWNDIDADSRAVLVSGFQTVKRLEMTYPKFESSNDTTDFISSFPLLTHLHIDGDAWRSLSLNPTYSPLPVNLTTVSVSAYNAGVLAELIRMEPHPSVRNLSLDFNSDDYNYNVAALLESIGDDLQELTFMNCMATIAGARALRSTQGIEFRHNTQLQQFTYRFRVPDAGGTVCEFLSNLKSSQLEHVTLMIPVASPDEIKDVDWEQMESVLTERRFGKLKTLAVACFDEGDDISVSTCKDHSGDIPELVKPRMPELSKRGILKILEQDMSNYYYR